MDPIRGWSHTLTDHFQIDEDLTFGLNNNTMNVLVSVTLPYTTIGGLLIGFGEVFLLTLIVLLIVGFIFSMRRVVYTSSIADRFSDSRTIPLLLLSASILLPWSVQHLQNGNSGFEGLSWMSWFPTPLMVRWTESKAMQVMVAVPGWWNVTLISTVFLFIPLLYGYLSLSSPETKIFDKTFALTLFLPYLVILTAFNLSAISMDTISIGPILTMLALPVWLMRQAFRKYRITT
jgi:hypothetical protein